MLFLTSCFAFDFNKVLKAYYALENKKNGCNTITPVINNFSLLIHCFRQVLACNLIRCTFEF